MNFNRPNIRQPQADLIRNAGEEIKMEIEKLFDKLSRCYYDEPDVNIHHFNGWNTSKSWVIRDKVIIPSMDAWFYGSYNPNYRCTEYLEDIERAFGYLDGAIE